MLCRVLATLGTLRAFRPGRENQVAKIVTLGCVRLFEALVTVWHKLLRPQDLEEIEYFRSWRQKVAKIVQCGEHSSKNAERPPAQVA